jgi:hypothetical protein
MAKATKQKKKADKKRANKYEQKLQINGSFDDLVKALVTPKTPAKKD